MLYSDAVQIYDRKMGNLEAHTKGAGSQIMIKQGWSDGEGLGRPDRKGRKSPIAVKGQLNSDKSGFGYEKYFIRATQPKEQIVRDNEFHIEKRENSHTSA